MAKGYFIVTEDIHDADALNAYVGKSLPTILQSGGKPIVFDPNLDVIEGEWKGTQVVILEFESVDAAKAWYNSPEYQAVVGERIAATDGAAVIVSGFEMPGA